MKRIVMLLCAMLCAGLLFSAVPAMADTEGDAKIVKTSGDFLSGYYVVYEMPSGRQYRSDYCGQQLNYDLWNLCSRADKMKALETYAFYESYARQQYGAYYDRMCEWYNTETGWAQAKETLRDRIAERDFGNLYHMFEELTLESHFEGKDIRQVSGLSELDEVRNYLHLVDGMKEVWNAGNAAYRSLVRVRQAQISTAVNAISSDLIGLITERALVPAITPGGLGALMPSVKGEIIGIVDKITGFSDTIITKTTEKKINAASARQLIDYYWQIIEHDQQLAQYCVDRFLSDKSELNDAWDKALEAVSQYSQGEYDKVRYTESLAADFAMAGITAQEPAGETREELQQELSALRSEADAWAVRNFGNGGDSARNTYKNRMNGILNGAIAFDWPKLYSDPIGIGNYSLVAGDRIDLNPTDICMREGGSGWISVLEWCETDLIPAFGRFDQKLEGRIDALETYIADYNAKIGSLREEWNAYYERFLGLQSALSAYGVNAEIPALNAYGDSFLAFADECGIYGKNQSSPGQTVEGLLDFLVDYRERFGRMADNLREDCEVCTSTLKRAAAEYRSLCGQYNQAIDEAESAYLEWLSVFEETEAKYFNPERGNQIAPELEAEYRQASNRQKASLFLDDVTEKGETLTECEARAKRCWGLSEELSKRMYALMMTYDDYGYAMRYVSGDLPVQRYTEYDFRGGLFLNGSLRRMYVERSIRELSGSDSMFFAADCTLLDIEKQKPNYMRMSEEDRRAFDSGACNSMWYTALRRGWEYTETKHTYTMNPLFGTTSDRTDWYDLYMGFADPSRPGSWGDQAKTYVVVTELKGPDSTEAGLLAEADLELPVGAVWDLGALITVLPDNATEKTLIFGCDDFEVCTVDGDGVVRAVGPGTAVISVRAKDSAWVQDPDTGEIIYTPAPLKYTVTVGGDTEASVSRVAGTDILWYNYGTEEEPRLFGTEDPGNGDTVVFCAADFGMQTDSSILLMFYSAEGRLLKLDMLSPAAADSGFNIFSETLPNPTGLRVKAIRVAADGTWLPTDAPCIDAFIPANDIK